MNFHLNINQNFEVSLLKIIDQLICYSLLASSLARGPDDFAGPGLLPSVGLTNVGSTAAQLGPRMLCCSRPSDHGAVAARHHLGMGKSQSGWCYLASFAAGHGFLCDFLCTRLIDLLCIGLRAGEVLRHSAAMVRTVSDDNQGR